MVLDQEQIGRFGEKIARCRVTVNIRPDTRVNGRLNVRDLDLQTPRARKRERLHQGRHQLIMLDLAVKNSK